MNRTRLFSYLKHFFPFYSTLKATTPTSLRDDLIAGITVALVLVPQAIAYAQLAGLPAEYGLYASLLPPIIAALFGSSRYLATGPVAVVSLITASTLAQIPTTDKQELIGYAILLAVLVGIIQLALGSLKLGLIVNFISHPVILGFSNAAAIIIATSQLPKVFGVYVDTYERHYETLYHFLLTAMKEVHLLSIVVAIYAFLAIIALKRVNPKIPGVLVTVIITTYFSFMVGFEQKAQISSETLHSQKLVALIETHNSLSDRIEKKTKEKNDFIHEQESLTKRGNPSPLALVEAGLGEQRVSFELEELKNQYRTTKQQLRSAQLVRVTGNSVTTVEEDDPTGANKKAVWHLKVGEGKVPRDTVTIVSGGSIVGKVPTGLPSFTPPPVSPSIIPQLFNSALIIALLGFMESISVAKSLASKANDKINPNQELIGQGLANVLGSFTQGYPVSGSFSRTAVNYQAGARTGLSSAFTSVFVLITLLFFTPLLYFLPQPVLAVIIILSVIGLVKFDRIMAAWRAHKSDGIIAIITFVSTLFYAPDLDKGIIIGVLLSTGYYIYTRAWPRITVLSADVNGVLHDAELYKLHTCKHIIVLRFDGSLFFANAAYLENKILSAIAAHPRSVTHIVLIGSGINYIDYTGIETLENLIKNLGEMNKKFIMVNFKSYILEGLRRSGIFNHYGRHMFKRERETIHAIYGQAHINGVEEACPLAPYVKHH